MVRVQVVHLDCPQFDEGLVWYIKKIMREPGCVRGRYMMHLFTGNKTSVLTLLAICSIYRSFIEQVFCLFVFVESLVVGIILLMQFVYINHFFNATPVEICEAFRAAVDS